MIKDQRTSENARVSRYRSDCRAPECQCWRGFLGIARITRLFEKTFSRDCHTGPTGTPGRHQKFSKYAVHPCDFPQPNAQQAFAANAMLCDLLRRATTWPGHPCATGRLRTHHRRATWAPLGMQLPPCPSARPAKRIPPECMGNAIYGPTGANFKEHPCTNINNMLPSIRVSAQTYTRRQYNAHSYTIT
jgi:hypothetical protein